MAFRQNYEQYQQRSGNDQLSSQQQRERNIRQYQQKDDPYRRRAGGSSVASSSEQQSKMKQDSGEIVLNAMVDFVSRYTDPGLSGDDKFSYALKYFHISQEFQQLTQEQQNWFKEQSRQRDNSEIVLDAMVDFASRYTDPGLSGDDKFSYALKYFHISLEFQRLTQEQQDFFKQELQVNITEISFSQSNEVKQSIAAFKNIVEQTQDNIPLDSTIQKLLIGGNRSESYFRNVIRDFKKQNLSFDKMSYCVKYIIENRKFPNTDNDGYYIKNGEIQFSYEEAELAKLMIDYAGCHISSDDRVRLRGYIAARSKQRKEYRRLQSDNSKKK